MAMVERFRHFVLTQRRRLATLFLLLGIVVIGKGFVTEWPREREVHYVFDAGLAHCKQARIDYLSEGEVVSALQVGFPDGVPTRVVHHPTLADGRYDVTIDLSLEGGQVDRHRRVLEVPYEGVMRFQVPLTTSHD